MNVMEEIRFAIRSFELFVVTTNQLTIKEYDNLREVYFAGYNAHMMNQGDPKRIQQMEEEALRLKRQQKELELQRDAIANQMACVQKELEALHIFMQQTQSNQVPNDIRPPQPLA